MDNIFKCIKRNNLFVLGFLLLFGVEIQIVLFCATLKFVPHGEGWFSGFGQVMWYLLYVQWGGYIVQFYIAWRIIKQFWKSVAICFVTIAVMLFGIELYSGIKNKIIEESSSKSEADFYKELEKIRKQEQDKISPANTPNILPNNQI